MTNEQKRRAAQLLQHYANAVDDVLYRHLPKKEADGTIAECEELSVLLDAEATASEEQDEETAGG